jgi:hypothetical protein
LPFGQKKESAFTTVMLRDRKLATYTREPSGWIAMPCGVVPTESGTGRMSPVVTSYSLPVNAVLPSTIRGSTAIGTSWTCGGRMNGTSEPVRNEPPAQSVEGVVPPGPKRDGPANTVVGSPFCPRRLLKMCRLLKN